ncbi:hypothetical protein [Xanthomonas euroxanthea]|uniref:hypothetical protein n=1 Tax=Xanthomonas euroxanthea TaxID=2259622 RepID=UPI0011B0DD40|nr:hypothetical protein [Xanthomonas euroxanthea]MBB3777748.1 hypothetical protein [Xanthomonas euroxanthea]
MTVLAAKTTGGPVRATHTARNAGLRRELHCRRAQACRGGLGPFVQAGHSMQVPVQRQHMAAVCGGRQVWEATVIQARLRHGFQVGK